MMTKQIKKILCLILIISFFTLNTMGNSNNIEIKSTNRNYSSQIIYVDDDNTMGPRYGTKNHPFETIQDGINNTSDYDTVFVSNGTYHQNIIINKKIKLYGENKDTTIISGGGNNDTISVKSENVIITGFTITNGSGNNWYKAGIRITSSHNTIYGNNIKYNNLGIFGKKVTNITIHNNTFTDDSVTFSLYDNEKEFVPFCEKYFIHNISNNVVNGKKLLYYINQKDFEIPTNAGQVIAINCKNMIIKNVNLTNADYGCILVNCSDCLIEHSNISSGDGMLWLIHSNKNRIQNNKISNNFQGICIDCKSIRNIVKFNTISKNQKFGIIIEDSSNFNIIYRNNFIENYYDESILQLQVSFISCQGNIWLRNYWNRPRLFPKLIIGTLMLKNNHIYLFNFDFLPSLRPYQQV